MKKLLSFLLVLALPFITQAKITNMNFSDAIRNKVIKLNAINFAGNYTGKSVRLNMTNLKADSLNITVDLGVILKPDSPAFQPMVLAGEEQLVLAPRKKGDVEVYVFCGNAPSHCPAKNLHFTFDRVGNDTLLKVLRYIHDNKLYDYLGQRAVWSITNHHQLVDVYDADRDSLSKKLIETISMVTGREKPSYYRVNAENNVPGQPAYSSKTLKLVIPFEFLLKASSIISVEVYDGKGFMMEQLIERKRFERGHHKFNVTFDSEPYGPGKYYVRLVDPEKVLEEKKVVAEE